MTVTVAIPVRDGARTLDEVLRAVATQRIDDELELLICDSGSRDASPDIARRHDARLIEIEPSEFSHGDTRNLLMRHARGERVALLTQDAVPADDGWLGRLLAALDAAPDVALACGPYRPRTDADPQTARELTRWFHSLAPDGAARIDRLAPAERALPPAQLFGRRTFFTDANACIRRAAWEQVPFRAVAYAEDQALALDMLRAGYAKAFAPDAVVIHSHRYGELERFRRCFDEWRGLLDVYGWREPATPPALLRALRGELAAQWRELDGTPPARRVPTLATATRHHVVRLAGAALGSRADRLPAPVARWCSLERRG